MTIAAPVPGVEEVAPRRFTIEEFERIPDDVFAEGERVELIDGLIYTKTGQNDPHYFAFHYTVRALQAVFGEGFAIMTQAPTRFQEGSKVEPDVLVLRRRIEDYEGRRVDPPSDVALLVEVSDASLAYDASINARLSPSRAFPSIGSSTFKIEPWKSAATLGPSWGVRRDGHRPGG